MTRDEIIKEFTGNLKMFEKLAYNIAGEEDAPDLFQACTLMLLEFTEDRLIGYYNPTQGLKPFFIRLLCNQYRSKTSKFHKEYKRQEIRLRDKMEDIILNEPRSEDQPSGLYMESISKACEGIYKDAITPQIAEIEKMVWELFVDEGSLRKTFAALPDEYADLLNLKDVHTIVKKFRRTIKERLCFED